MKPIDLLKDLETNPFITWRIISNFLGIGETYFSKIKAGRVDMGKKQIEKIESGELVYKAKTEKWDIKFIATRRKD